MDALIQHFKTENILTLIFYRYDNRCKYIKCMDMNTGFLFFVRISGSLELEIPKDFYVLDIEFMQRVPIVSDDLPYPDNESSLDNDVDAMYASIHMEEDNDTCKCIYEQIRRLGLCFRHVEPRFIIERKQMLCELCTDFSLHWFQIRGSKADTNNWYILCPLQILQNKIINYETLNRIDNRLMSILEKAHEDQIKILDNLKLGFFIKEKRQEVLNRKRSLCSESGKVKRQLKEFIKKREQLTFEKEKYSRRSSNHPSVEGERLMAQQGLDEQLKIVNDNILQMIEQIQTNTGELKRSYLEADFLFYFLSKSALAFKQVKS